MIIRPFAALLLALTIPFMAIADEAPATPAVTPESEPPVVTPEEPAKPAEPPAVTPEEPAKPDATPPKPEPSLPEPPAESAPESPEPAAPLVQTYTDPADTDADFPFQGEYAGTLNGQQVGLQVVAQGGGNFIATQYGGGLPGDGWDGSARVNYTGSRESETVTLSSDNRQVVIDANGVATLNGETAQGTLKKVHRKSATLELPAPKYAQVLFDGSNADAFVDGQVEDGLLLPGTQFKDTYKNYRLHLEYLPPYMPAARGQKRANSGVYLQGRYELQILDSFGLETLDNGAGALYESVPPRVNMAFPPLTWQTYDIDFQSPLFDYDGNKTRPARLTVWLNGVKVQEDLDISNKTGAGAPEGPEPLPIKLQDHGNPVRFRNIWLINYDTPAKQEPTPTQVFAPEAYYGLNGSGASGAGGGTAQGGNYLVAQWPIYPYYPMYPYGQSVYSGVTPVLDQYGPSTQPYVYPTNWWHRFGYYPYQGVQFHHYPQTGWSAMEFNPQLGTMTPTGSPVPGWQPIYSDGGQVYPHYNPLGM